MKDWKELYEVASRLESLKPWKYFEETDCFSINLPKYGGLYFCSIMGALGESLTISVYKPQEYQLLKTYMETNNNNQQSMQVVRCFNCLSVEYSNRVYVPKESCGVIKKIGLKFRDNNSWIYFENHTSGYMPCNLVVDEVIVLTQVLQHLFCQIKTCFVDNAMDVDFEKQVLYREYSKEKGIWLNFPVSDFPFPSLEFDVPELTDEITLTKLKKKAYIADIEIDTLHFPMIPIEALPDGPNRKLEKQAYGQVLLFVNHDDGKILYQETIWPEKFASEEYSKDYDEAWNLWDTFLQYVEDNGRPKNVYVRDLPHKFALYTTCEQLGIKLYVTDLPMCDNFEERLLSVIRSMS
ncbi:MAG: hypothetical protein LBE76_04075 [Nitrososphaerota archaeon]|nr:hypothetical protein [Nitrososphaerota archaeon]